MTPHEKRCEEIAKRLAAGFNITLDEFITLIVHYGGDPRWYSYDNISGLGAWPCWKKVGRPRLHHRYYQWENGQVYLWDFREAEKPGALRPRTVDKAIITRDEVLNMTTTVMAGLLDDAR